MTEKTHARDYLMELAKGRNIKGWMHDLIVRTVNSNGLLTDDDLAATTAQLKANGAKQLSVVITPSAADPAVPITLTELVHHSGVNALACEQTIRFSSHITLLFGVNGTGKSIYFRILNEIVGGNRTIPIHHNIFDASPKPFNAELRYTANGEHKVLHWYGNTRKIPPLTQASVFDSGYTADLLEKRSADTAIVRPLGLHLFTALTADMGSIKSRLGQEIEGLRCTLPHINLDHLSAEVRSVINQQRYTPQQKQSITERFTMTAEKQKELDDCQKRFDELNATNYDDKIKLVQIDFQLAEGQLSYVVDTHLKLQQLDMAIGDLSRQMAEATRQSEEARQKIKILGEIGNTDSAEWKAFIASGAAFAESSTIAAGICPYCRQELKDDAIDIIKAYAEFLHDQTEAWLRQLLHEQTQLKLQLDALRLKTSLNEREESVLGKLKEPYLAVMKAFRVMVEGYRLRVNDYTLKEGVSQQTAVVPLIAQLQLLIAKLKTELDNLKQAKATKDDELRNLSQRRNALLEHQAIAAQKESLGEWFAIMHKIHRLGECQDELASRTVSSLSKAASQQLLSESLREKFQEELNALRLSHLEVSLGEEGARSGQTFMKIRLAANVRTQEILSEGEQKGVALALFMAERHM